MKFPESLILHVGTNDLLSIQTPQQIAENIVNLADQIESDSPGTLVTISAICVRKEDELWKKATEINSCSKDSVPIEDGAFFLISALTLRVSMRVDFI